MDLEIQNLNEMKIKLRNEIDKLRLQIDDIDHQILLISIEKCTQFGHVWDRDGQGQTTWVCQDVQEICITCGLMR